MNKIRDIIGMCHLIDGLEYEGGVVKEFDRGVFVGTVNQCHDYVSLYKRMAKHKQVAELLETICRGNIEALREKFSVEGVKEWATEVEEVILSDEEVNDKEMRK